MSRRNWDSRAETAIDMGISLPIRQMDLPRGIDDDHFIFATSVHPKYKL